jgi:YfiR/HmsC-like
MKPWRAMLWPVLWAFLGASPGASALAQSTAVSDVALKSALFFKLPQFVYRTEDARDQPLSVCLLGNSTGNSSFGGAFEKLAQVPIDGRAVKFAKLASASEAGRCDFIYIAHSEAGALETVLRRLAGLPVVTVSDIAGFAKAGGMVELAMGGDGAAVSILINRRAARQQNIEFNAQLLRLAKVVEP